MGEHERSFKDRVMSGEALVGLFLNTGASTAAELSVLAGFDWVVLDLEHGLGTEADLLPQLHSLAGTATSGIVRVESSSRNRIGRVLDMGASAVMIPQIETAEQARDAVSFLRYPPDGIRGVAMATRGNQYGIRAHTDVAEINAGVLGVFQIESALAVENVRQIAALDGVDVLFVGPSDLSHSLGVPGELEHADFKEAVRRVAEVGRDSGKALGVQLPGVNEVPRFLDLGYRLIGVGSDSSMLRGVMASTVEAAHVRFDSS